MGSKGLLLKDGVITPNGEQLRQDLALWGPAVKPGDPARISYVRIKDDHIHFEINGGPTRHKKWYQRVEVTGAYGAPVNRVGLTTGKPIRTVRLWTFISTSMCPR